MTATPNQATPILETERTFLRQLTLEDTESVFRIFSDPETMRYSPAETTQDREAVEGFIRWNIENYRERGFGAWAVIAKSNEEFIGQAGLIPHEMSVEVFYSFIREFWGQGFASEVASACKDYAFKTLGETRLISIIHPENERAINVVRKLGMQEAGAIELWSRTNRLFEICRTVCAPE